jgi:hypothetical protein
MSGDGTPSCRWDNGIDAPSLQREGALAPNITAA